MSTTDGPEVIIGREGSCVPWARRSMRTRSSHKVWHVRTCSQPRRQESRILPGQGDQSFALGATTNANSRSSEQAPADGVELTSTTRNRDHRLSRITFSTRQILALSPGVSAAAALQIRCDSGRLRTCGFATMTRSKRRCIVHVDGDLLRRGIERRDRLGRISPPQDILITTAGSTPADAPPRRRSRFWPLDGSVQSGFVNVAWTATTAAGVGNVCVSLRLALSAGVRPGRDVSLAEQHRQPRLRLRDWADASGR